MKKAAFTPMQFIVFVPLGILVIAGLFTSLVVAFNTSNIIFDQTPQTARAQILTHKILTCFGGTQFDQELFTTEQLNTCYPVDPTERVLYPVQLTLEIQGEQQKVASRNSVSQDVVIKKIPIVTKENKLGQLTIAFEQL